MKKKIVAVIREVAESMNLNLVDPLADDTVLLECGLDSLGFAIVVSRLEEDLGYDPFVIMKEPIYPHTLAEFVRVYEATRPS